MAQETDLSKYNFFANLSNLIRTRQNKRVQSILQRKNEINLTDDTGSTLLHLAAGFGNEIVTQYLIVKDYEINAQDNLGRTPLMRAVIEKQVLATKVLLHENANLHIPDCYGKTVLDMTIYSKPLNVDMVKIFFQKVSIEKMAGNITRSILADKFIKADWTLHDAIFFDNIELVRLLLEHGYPTDFINENEKTALHLAVQLEKSQIVKLLVEYGANVDAVDSQKMTPLYYLYYFDHSQTGWKFEIFKLLFQRTKPTSLTTTNFCGEMQISAILRYGSKEAVKMILQVIDWEVTDANGNSVLCYLASNTNFDCFKEFKGKIFNVNTHNNIGLTALHHCAITGNVNLARFLLDNKADVNVKKRGTGKTPLFYTYRNRRIKYNECVELFLQHGANIHFFHSGINFDYTIFDEKFSFPCYSLKSVFEHLVLCQMRGMKIDEVIEKKINSNSQLKNYFDRCQRYLKGMTEIILFGKVTLFDFITASDARASFYVFNEELVSELKKMIETNKFHSLYLLSLLKNHLANALKRNKLKKRASHDLSKITDLRFDAYPLIVECIIDYFDCEDFEKLHRACRE